MNQEPRLRLYRRHTRACPHRLKGWDFTKCSCPIHADGDLNGRQYRRSMKTRSWDRALAKLAKLENPEAPPPKPIADATKAWLRQLDVQEASTVKYTRLMSKLEKFCEQRGLEHVEDMGLEELDAFRESRKKKPRKPEEQPQPISRTTAAKELQTLRQFFAFCLDRAWVRQNYAKKIKTPRFQPNEVVPYTPQQVAQMLVACEGIGQSAYERLRARALVLLLRYTGLRIMDAVTLARDRVAADGKGGWQIQLFTQKTKGHVMLPIPSELKAALDALPFPMREDGSAVDSGYFFWSGAGKKSSARGIAERMLEPVFRDSKIIGAHAHRFRHTLATDILAKGGTMADVADVLGISEHIARRHYAKWSPARQERISTIMRLVQSGELAPTVHDQSKPTIQ